MANDFYFSSSGGWSDNHYKSGTNLSFGFKLSYVSGKTIRITAGLRNFEAGGGSYTYSYSYYYGNYFSVNGDTHSSKYDGYYYSSVGNSWKEIDTWDITLTEGGASGNTAKSISYSMCLQNSCFPDGTSGTLYIPAGVVPSSQYYTACTAPTSVSISPSIVKPNGTITITWSNASGGINNSINGYSVYYYITSNGTAPSTGAYTEVKTVISTSTSGSTTFTISSSATRNYKIVAGVITRGSAGSTWYSAIKTGGSSVVNNLPNAPTLSKSYQYFSSSGGTISATVTAGATNDSGQTATIYYNSSNSHIGETSISSGSTFTSPTLSSDTTYYFWTWDGLEYSSSSTFIGYKNTNPSPGAATVTNITSGTNSKVSGTFYSRLGSIKYNSITRSRYSQNTGAATYISSVIRYKNKGSSNNWSEKTIKASTSIGTGSTADIGGYNLINNIGLDQEWYIITTVSDGLNQASTQYPTSGVLYTPPRPDFKKLVNRFNTTDIENFTDQFYENGRIYLSKDTIFTNITIIFSINTSPTTTINKDGVVVFESNQEYFDFNIPYISNYGGKTLTISQITLGDGYNNVNISLSPSPTRTIIYQPTFTSNSLTGMVNPYKPYTNNSTTTITVGLLTGLNESNYANYGLTQYLPEIKLYMVNGSYSQQITNGSWSISNSTLSRIINLNQLYDPNTNNLHFANIYGSFTYTLQITVTNAFGYTNSVNKTYTIDFSEMPEITNEALKVTDINGVSIENIVLQKGMTVYYTFNIESYNQGTISYSLNYSLNNSTENGITIISGNEIFSRNTSFNKMTDNSDGELAIIMGTWTVPEFSTAGDIYFSITLNNSSNNTNRRIIFTSQHNRILPSDISINTQKADSNVEVSFQSNWVNTGITLLSSSSITYTHSYQVNVYASITDNPVSDPDHITGSTTSTDFPTNITVVIDPDGNKFLNIIAITTHTINEYYNGTLINSATQIITSNIYAYYDEVPSVSYRKNKVIINSTTSELATDVLTVHAITGQTNIRLIGVGGHNEGIVTISLASGPSIMTSISNILIDGGVWA